MNELSPLERCMKVLHGEMPDRVPVVPQSFLLSLITAGMKMKDVVHHGKKMARSHIICQEKYGYDGCVIDFDDVTLAEACGARVIYRDDEPAVLDERDVVLKDLRDVDGLKLPDPQKDGRIPVWLEATHELVSEIGDHVFVMGRADQGPFSLACLLRGPQQFMMDLMVEEPELIMKVIDYCRRACVVFAKAQKDAGAHATSIGDAFAGPNLISPGQFRQFALEPEISLTEEVRAYEIPFSIHICGDTREILPDMAGTGADILEVDSMVDMKVARELAAPETVLMGNINPSDPMVFGTPGAVEEAARKVILATDGRGLFLSTGCAMGRNTPEENFRSMIRAAWKYGSYDQLMQYADEAD